MTNATLYAIQLTTLGGFEAFLATTRDWERTSNWHTSDPKRAWTWKTRAGAERALAQYPELQRSRAKVVTL